VISSLFSVRTAKKEHLSKIAPQKVSNFLGCYYVLGAYPIDRPSTFYPVFLCPCKQIFLFSLSHLCCFVVGCLQFDTVAFKNANFSLFKNLAFGD
jgi:hypothetical protein